MAKRTIVARGGRFCDLLWTAARRRQDFTHREMAKATGANPRTVQKIFGVWVKGGALTYTSGKRGQRFYRVVHNNAQTPCYPPRPTEALWLAMKMNKVFTAAELTLVVHIAGVEVSEQAALSYCKRLARAGYLAVVRPSTPECTGDKIVYRFVRSTGPCAPMITPEKKVFDPNLKKIVKRLKEKKQ